jgi:hypothetical protein
MLKAKLTLVPACAESGRLIFPVEQFPAKAGVASSIIPKHQAKSIFHSIVILAGE